MTSRHDLLALAILVTMIPQQATFPGADTADRGLVLRVTQAYRDAWLANDADRVMATLTPDAVILPSGLRPIQGAAQIKAFWFPADTTTTVTAMELTVRSVHLSGDLAVVRGDGSLTYETRGSAGATPPVTLRSWFVNVLRKQPDGRWLIAERAWSDQR